VFAWAQNRHAITGWFGIGSGIDTFLQVRGGEALHLLRRMFREHRLFRLIIDEAEKTLATVDLGIARDYAALVDSEAARDAVFAMIAREFELTCARIVEISEAPRIAERFERYRGRLAVRLPMIDAVNREQVELLRRYRCSADETAKAALLRSINCIAAGFGTTG
jgi:phosphoenolpyruvate carboxylase